VYSYSIHWVQTFCLPRLCLPRYTVKTEPGLVGLTCTTPVPQQSAPATSTPTPASLPTTPVSTDTAAIKEEQGMESTHELIK